VDSQSADRQGQFMDGGASSYRCHGVKSGSTRSESWVKRTGPDVQGGFGVELWSSHEIAGAGWGGEGWCHLMCDLLISIGTRMASSRFTRRRAE
jgi:hypothetical protein